MPEIFSFKAAAMLRSSGFLFIFLVHGGLAVNWNDWGSGMWANFCNFTDPNMVEVPSTGQVPGSLRSQRVAIEMQHFYTSPLKRNLSLMPNRVNLFNNFFILAKKA